MPNVAVTPLADTLTLVTPTSAKLITKARVAHHRRRTNTGSAAETPRRGKSLVRWRTIVHQCFALRAKNARRPVSAIDVPPLLEPGRGKLPVTVDACVVARRPMLMCSSDWFPARLHPYGCPRVCGLAE